MQFLEKIRTSMTLPPKSIKVYRVTDINSSIDLLSKYIKNTNKELYIRGGELNSLVWSDIRILSALKQLPPSCKIKMIAGPNLDYNDSVILAWGVVENKIQLYKQKDREGKHFRIFDDYCISIEDPHVSFASTRDTVYIENQINLVNTYKKNYNQLINDELVIPIDKNNYKNEFKFVLHDRDKKLHKNKEPLELRDLEKIISN